MITLLRGACSTLLLSLLVVSSASRAECAGWKIKFDGSDSNPVIADGVLYVGSADGAVYALDPTNGTTKWRFQTGDGLLSGPEIITMPKKGASSDEMIAKGIDALREPRVGKRSVDLTPVVRNGTVFIGAGDCFFYALDAVTGEKKWSYAAGSQIFRTAVHEDGAAYIVTEKGLHALDASTGQRKWLFETLQEIPVQQMNDVRLLGRRPAKGPAQGEKMLFLTAWPNRLSITPQKAFVYAVAPDSGTTKWVTALDGLEITEPVAAKGLVYVAAEDPRSPPRPGNPLGASSNHGTLYAINAADGQIKWKLGADRMYGTSRPLIAGNAIYFQTDKSLIAAEMETGRQLWSFSAEDIQGDPGVDDQQLYVVTHKGTMSRPADTLRALSLTTGREKWSLELGGGAYVHMVHQGVVYAGRENLYAIDAATGARLWSFEEFGRAHSAQLLSGGRIFAISPTVDYIGKSRVDQGYLYALDAKTGQP